jgi:hypothetical protein
MDMRTGRIFDFESDGQLEQALKERESLVKLSRSERRKLALYEEAARPAELTRLRSISADRNKAKAARKARRKQRGK